MRKKCKSIMKVLLLVAATIAVVHYGYRDLKSFTNSFTTSDKSSDDVKPTDTDLWYFSFTSSYNFITTKPLYRYSPNTEEELEDAHKEKTADHAGLLENATEIPKVDRVSQHGMKPTHPTRLFSSKYEERKTDHTATTLPDSDDKSEDFVAQQASKKRLTFLFEESKDVFDLLPYTYLPDHKSFCWYDSRDEFQCLASVYLAGMPKCGTTDLFDKLMWHPELTTQSHRPKGGPEKECFYWTRTRIGRPVNFMANPRVPPPKTLFSQFLTGTGAERVKNNKEMRIVDGTPSLLWDLGGWETRYPGFDEPPYSNGDLIHAVTPDAKILAILRNPIDRLYSEYLYFWKGMKMRKEARSPQTFHLDVARESRKFNRCLESKSLRHCCYSSDHSLRLRVALGVYVCYIRDFLEVFGDNLLVVTMNEYHSYPVETLTNIFYHIGVSKPNLEDLRYFIENSKTYNMNSDVKEGVGEMLDETRELLKTFYDPYNSELATLLGHSKYLFV